MEILLLDWPVWWTTERINAETQGRCLIEQCLSQETQSPTPLILQDIEALIKLMRYFYSHTQLGNVFSNFLILSFHKKILEEETLIRVVFPNDDFVEWVVDWMSWWVGGWEHWWVATIEVLETSVLLACRKEYWGKSKILYQGANAWNDVAPSHNELKNLDNHLKKTTLKWRNMEMIFCVDLYDSSASGTSRYSGSL